MPQTPGQAYGYVALAIGGWATAATAFKLAFATGLDYVQLLALSALCSALVLIGTLAAQNKLKLLWQQTPAQIGWSALQGLFNPFGYYLILFKAYEHLPAQVAMALNYTWPLVLALLAVPILGERLRGKTLIAIAVSLVGIVLIASRGELASLRIEDPVGVGLALGSAAIWALSWLTNVRDQRDAVLKLSMGFLFGAAYSVAVVPLLSDPIWPDLQQWGLTAYIGIAEMGLTFVAWLRALELAGNRGSIANWVYLAPFLSLALISLVLGEQIAPASVLGLVLIVGSILWQSRQVGHV